MSRLKTHALLIAAALAALFSTTAAPAQQPAQEPIVTEFFRGEPTDPLEGLKGFMLTPDGKRVIFERANEPNLVSINLEEPSDWSYLSRPREDVYEYNRYLSPDGRYLSYESIHKTSSGGSYTVLNLAKTDGSEPPTTVVDGVNVSFAGKLDTYFSPDSKWAITRVDKSRQLVAIPTDHSQPMVSQFRSTESKDWSELKFTPDSKYVVFSKSYELYSVPLAGGEAIHLGSQVSVFTLTPDGHFVVYRKGSRLWSVPVDGSSTAVDLTPSAGQASNALIGYSVSPDSTRVCMDVNESLFVAPTNGSEVSLRLADTFRYNRNILWTPDASSILFYDPTGSVSSVASNGATPPRKLPATSGLPALSASGRWMVYQRGDDVFAALLDGTAPARVVFPGMLRDLHLFPARDTVYYVTGGTLFIEDLDHSAPPRAILHDIDLAKDWITLASDESRILVYRAATKSFSWFSVASNSNSDIYLDLPADWPATVIRAVSPNESSALIATKVNGDQNASLYTVQ